MFKSKREDEFDFKKDPFSPKQPNSTHWEHVIDQDKRRNHTDSMYPVGSRKNIGIEDTLFAEHDPVGKTARVLQDEFLAKRLAAQAEENRSKQLHNKDGFWANFMLGLKMSNYEKSHKGYVPLPLKTNYESTTSTIQHKFDAAVQNHPDIFTPRNAALAGGAVLAAGAAAHRLVKRHNEHDSDDDHDDRHHASKPKNKALQKRHTSKDQEDDNTSLSSLLNVPVDDVDKTLRHIARHVLKDHKKGHTDDDEEDESTIVQHIKSALPKSSTAAVMLGLTAALKYCKDNNIDLSNLAHVAVDKAIDLKQSISSDDETHDNHKGLESSVAHKEQNPDNLPAVRHNKSLSKSQHSQDLTLSQLLTTLDEVKSQIHHKGEEVRNKASQAISDEDNQHLEQLTDQYKHVVIGLHKLLDLEVPNDIESVTLPSTQEVASALSKMASRAKEDFVDKTELNHLKLEGARVAGGAALKYMFTHDADAATQKVLDWLHDVGSRMTHPDDTYVQQKLSQLKDLYHDAAELYHTSKDAGVSIIQKAPEIAKQVSNAATTSDTALVRKNTILASVQEPPSDLWIKLWAKTSSYLQNVYGVDLSQSASPVLRRGAQSVISSPVHETPTFMQLHENSTATDMSASDYDDRCVGVTDDDDTTLPIDASTIEFASSYAFSCCD